MDTIYQHPELDGNSYHLVGGDHGVILLHGFTATTVETRRLGERLHAEGYSVSAPLLPGHGTNPEDLNRQTLKTWLSAVEDTYMQLREQCSVIHIAGESMGGLLSILMADKHPDIKTIMLYAPALKIPTMQYAWLLAPFLPYIEKGYAKKDSPDIGWQGYNVVPLKAAVQVTRLQQAAFKALPRVKQPALIIQGRNDHTIDPQSSQLVHDKIGSIEKQLVWLDQSGHVILLDLQWEKAAELSLSFLRQHA